MAYGYFHKLFFLIMNTAVTESPFIGNGITSIWTSLQKHSILMNLLLFNCQVSSKCMLEINWSVPSNFLFSSKIAQFLLAPLLFGITRPFIDAQKLYVLQFITNYSAFYEIIKMKKMSVIHYWGWNLLFQLIGVNPGDIIFLENKENPASGDRKSEICFTPFTTLFQWSSLQILCHLLNFVTLTSCGSLRSFSPESW